MAKPRLLNLCCCAGASCRGYELAGFDVTGVDIEAQPHYLRPDRFVHADALDVLADPEFVFTFDAVHASPPCQSWSRLNAYNQRDYPQLIEPIRDRLVAYNLPYVIENVPGAPLKDPMYLCGYMFPNLLLQRHRLFELGGGFSVRQPYHPGHDLRCTRNSYLPTPDAPLMSIHGGKHSRAWQRKACEVMDTPWLALPDDADAVRTRQGIREVCEAIPPAFSKWIGDRLMDHILTIKGVPR